MPNYFDQLDLSQNHGKLYLALLELGRATYKELAERSKIPRSSCYEYMPDLIELGLVSQTVEDKKRFLIPEDPKKLEQLVLEKDKEWQKAKEVFASQLPKLGSLYGALYKKPTVKFYQGVEGIKTILDLTLESPEEILVLCQGKEAKHLSQDDSQYLVEYFEAFSEKECRSREIVEDRGAARDYQLKYQTKLHQIRISPPISRKEISHIDKFIWEDQVAVIFYGEERAIYIQDKAMAANEKISFEVMWKSVEKGVFRY